MVSQNRAADRTGIASPSPFPVLCPWPNKAGEWTTARRGNSLCNAQSSRRSQKRKDQSGNGDYYLAQKSVAFNVFAQFLGAKYIAYPAGKLAEGGKAQEQVAWQDIDKRKIAKGCISGQFYKNQKSLLSERIGPSKYLRQKYTPFVPAKKEKF